jgi:hypothetical protein
MDYLTEHEVNALKRDVRNGDAKQATEKMMFEKRLLGGLGDEIEDAVEHPEKMQKTVKFARKANRKKRWTIWKENLSRILGTKKETV